eukprot:jgi/Tetstr1/462714/TSEL_007678.t1
MTARPRPPDAPSIKCEGHLRLAHVMGLQGYTDYAANARQRWLEDVMAQVRKLQITRVSDAADGPAGVFNQEPRRNMWLKLH